MGTNFARTNQMPIQNDIPVLFIHAFVLLEPKAKIWYVRD